MIELVRTNDVVLISWLEAALNDVGIDMLVFDGNASVVEGSLPLLQRRVMVLEEDLPRARVILSEAYLDGEA